MGVASNCLALIVGGWILDATRRKCSARLEEQKGVRTCAGDAVNLLRCGEGLVKRWG